MMTGDILVVDDEPDIRELIGDILRDEGFRVRLSADADSCLAEINANPPALVILDIWLKGSRLDGIEILETVRRDNPEIPVVIISGHGNIEIAVAAIKQGAYDFIEKPFNIDQLLVVIQRATEAARLRRENLLLKSRERGMAEMVGEAAAFRQLRAQLDKVTQSNARVMLSGPNGAGKDVAARYIHMQSPRAAAPFVTVPCATIEPGRMEEVLFGRETPDRGVESGLLEQAHDGVIYFDEVADMPVGTQSKLLRVLIDQQFRRVGGSDSVRVNLRVVSSTTRDLKDAIARGQFREELYHRLNVVPITVPALDERREDIPLLARHFLVELHEAHGLPARELSDDAAAMLQTMRWTGNLRQLRNVMERVLIMGEGTGPIGPDEVPGEAAPHSGTGGFAIPTAVATLPLRDARELFEREYLLAQVNRFGGNISRTASFVGMERSALHRKLKSLNVVTGPRGARAGEPTAPDPAD
jgi:two-component system nitrogen regulation response regulator NtrX